MPDKIALSVVTPQRQLLSIDTQWVELPATSGQMRALPGHAPTLGELGAGQVRYQSAGADAAEHSLQVSGGFFEVLGDKITLLADSAQPA